MGVRFWCGNTTVYHCTLKLTVKIDPSGKQNRDLRAHNFITTCLTGTMLTSLESPLNSASNSVLLMLLICAVAMATTQGTWNSTKTDAHNISLSTGLHICSHAMNAIQLCWNDRYSCRLCKGSFGSEIPTFIADEVDTTLLSFLCSCDDVSKNTICHRGSTIPWVRLRRYK